MRLIFTLIGIVLMVTCQSMSQSAEVYAAAYDKRASRPVLLPANSLKEGLKQVEKVFNVSIAYKDEWVEGKKAETSVFAFTSAEQALDGLLENTGLYYKKAGDDFYVIAQVRSEQRSHGGQSASTSIMPLVASSQLMGSLAISNTFSMPLSPVESDVDITVTGRVTDENNQGFPGVNIIVKGTTVGSNTDADGKYSISVPNESSVLVFSFVGYATQEIVVGNRTNIDVVLAPDIQSLDEVVVTALGIEKSSKSLGYSATKVNSDELTINRTPNVMNALQGKIAGVNVQGLGTGPGGTSKIRIRGQSSMTGQNNPLIVINGVPVDNTNFGTNPNNMLADNSIGARAGGGVTADGGDSYQSLNPDDIESMTVLKGAAASALYGSRAKDGVIMITTKSKGDGRGIGLSYNLNYTLDQPLDFTDYQYEYGQGENGARPTAPNPTSGQWSFGERFQPGMTQILFDGVEVPYVPQRNIIKEFFRNGQNITHTISLSTSGDKGGFNLSLANMENKGIVPNNKFERKIVNFGFSHELNDKLSFKGNINYSNEVNTNPPNVGNQDNTIPVAIYNMANSMPMWLLNEKKYNAQGNEYVYSRFMNRTNPYWTLAEQFHNIRRDRVFGNVSLKYNILPWLSVQGRAGQDFWTRDEDYNNFPTGHASRAAAPSGFVNGVYTQEARRFREVNADFLITADKKFGDFRVNVNAGGNKMTKRFDNNSVQVTDFIVRGLYTVQNGRAKDPTYSLREQAVNSLYGAAEFSYKDFVFVNATLREDWFSTLSAADRSELYPSATGSFVFSEAFTMPSFINFGKLRVGYAEVGSDSDVAPYSQSLFYGFNANLASTPSGATQPVATPNGTTLPNPALRPMTAEEVEIGLDLKFLQNRLGLDLAVYEKTTKNQIVRAQVSDGSGFTDRLINSGTSRNRGIEMLLNVVPVESTNFVWEFTANASYNITKVLSIITDTPGERITTGTHIFNGELRHVVGEELAQVSGFGYRRDPATGQKIFGSNGLPLRSLDLIHFGSALPKWVGGFLNSFTYKGINMSFLIDFKLGGKMLSGTNFNAVRHGLHKMTLEGREGGVIGQGLNEAGEPNTVVAPVQAYWEVVRSQQLVEPIIYNSGYWKLRQVSIGYDFVKHIPQTWPVKGLRLNFVANNVLMLKKWVPNIDPESFGYSSDNLVGMESTGLPTTRSMGFNLNVKF